MKLNLACGKHKIPGWMNVDVSEQVGPDVVADLLKFPWRFGPCGLHDSDMGMAYMKSDEIEEIFCSHFVEHIGDELIAFMDEAHRVLKPGGLFRIRCPYYTSIRAVQDPTHKRFISEAMFQYFSAEGRKRLGMDHYPIKADFDVQEMRFHFPEEMQHIPEDERKYLLQHCWNTAADIEVLLRKHDPNEQSVDRQENKMVPN